jgi:hypothetical protein
MVSVMVSARMTEDYVRSVGRLAYLWGWPLVNMHNRLSIMEKLPGPGLLGGVVPAASPAVSACCPTTSPPRKGSSPARTRMSCTASGSSTPSAARQWCRFPISAAGSGCTRQWTSAPARSSGWGPCTRPKQGCTCSPGVVGRAGARRHRRGVPVRHPDRGMYPPGVHGRHRRRPGRHPARHQPGDGVPAEPVHRPDAHHRLDRRTGFPDRRRYLG